MLETTVPHSKRPALGMLKQLEQLARCVLGVPDAQFKKVTGGGWALRFI